MFSEGIELQKSKQVVTKIDCLVKKPENIEDVMPLTAGYGCLKLTTNTRTTSLKRPVVKKKKIKNKKLSGVKSILLVPDPQHMFKRCEIYRIIVRLA